jgi:cystathionine gamma-synthase
LFPRIERQQETASAVASALAADDRVAKVYYPGLAYHPGHELARRQQRGFGAMLSVEFAESVDAHGVLRALQIFTIAESLGGFESLVCTPATMTHAAMTPEARRLAGISDRLVRFSIGLEHPQDLIRDIFTALDAIQAPGAANVAYLRKQDDAHAC